MSMVPVFMKSNLEEPVFFCLIKLGTVEAAKNGVQQG
jgi:hypothetical protein